MGWAGKAERCGSKRACARLDSAKKASLWLASGLQGVTTLRAPARKEEQRRKRAVARLNRVRSAVTPMVTVLVGTKVSVHQV